MVLAGLAVTLGTIVFAVRADGRDPFGPTNVANPQLERMVDDLDRLAVAFQGPTSTSTKQTAHALTLSELYSHWRSRLTTTGRASADEKVPSALAAAFARVAKRTIGPGTKNLLASLFSRLLEPPGPRSASAAAGLASIASLLPEVQQARLAAALSGAMAHALDGVVHGGSEEFGKRTIDSLFDWLDGSEPSASGTDTVKVEVIPPGPIKVKLASPPPITVTVTAKSSRKPPSSFVWGDQTWEWGEFGRFELSFTMAHKGETKACIRQQLVMLYEHHPVIRHVFGIATPRRRAIAPCH